MWQRGDMLLAFTLIIALHSKVFEVGAADQLDMASNAVDDQYANCRDKMLEKVVDSGLLSTELNKDELFKKAWGAGKQCLKLPPGGQKEHTEAMQAYGNGGREFRESFNTAVQTLGGNTSVYTDQFQFKSLHFLLMDAMRLLKKDCQTVFHIMPGKNSLQEGSEVRFGRFTSAFSDKSELLEDPALGTGMLLKIESCLVLNFMGNTCSGGDEVELLLSPMEMFKVGNITKVSNEDYVYTEISLTHSKIHSNHDCYLFSQVPSTSVVSSLSRTALMFVFLSLFAC